MRATGIVRRIDELGRVVIPKDIRQSVRIREGDPLEIYIGKDGEVILKKYSPIGEHRGTADGAVTGAGKAAYDAECIKLLITALVDSRIHDEP